MKKIISILLIICLSFGFKTSTFANEEIKNEAETNELPFEVDAKSAVLMEAETGKILYSKNAEASYSPASVTKIMTLLIVAEALAAGKISLSDTVSVSEYASSMGGSQVFLKEGERMSVEELIKCTVIASANDAALALAEHVCGSEDAFVKKMNVRAMELGLKSTNFENVTGLDDTTVNHVTGAYDIAVMSRELIRHDIILKYSSLWQDSIRDGAFTLTNTNRLVRYYDGCNGLKTGSTSKAGFCMSATAKRDGMQLIAVVMGAETRDSRNAIAKKLLDYGFSSYGLYKNPETCLGFSKILFGKVDTAKIYSGEFEKIIEKGNIGKVTVEYSIKEEISAPLSAYDEVGHMTFLIDGEKIGECPIYVKEDIEKITFLDLYKRFILVLFNNY